MLRERLRRMENVTEGKVINNIKQLEAIRSIQELLGQIDHSAELIPEGNLKKLNELLETIKGKQLSKEEIKLLKALKNL